MCRKKTYYEVLTDEGREFFTDEKRAYSVFRTMVERNKDCAVNEMVLVKRLFGAPKMKVYNNILDFERVDD